MRRINQQEVYQNLLRNVIAADFEIAAQMLRCVTTPFVITEDVSREFCNESLRELRRKPGEPEDEIIEHEGFKQTRILEWENQVLFHPILGDEC